MANLNITGDALADVKAFAKERGITQAEAAEKLISTGYSRLAALEKYAAGKGSKKKPAKKKKKAPAKKKRPAAKKKATKKRKLKPKPKAA